MFGTEDVLRHQMFYDGRCLRLSKLNYFKHLEDVLGHLKHLQDILRHPKDVFKTSFLLRGVS